MQKVKRAQSASEGYPLLFDTNPQPMFIIDRESLAFLKVNEAAVLSYGFTRPEFLAMKLPEIWPAADRPRFIERVGEMPDGRQEIGLRRHQKKDGSIITVSVTRDTIDFAGSPALLASVRDVTDDHSLREALKEQEDVFRLMVEGIKDYGIIMLDSGGRVMSWNEGARRTTGYAAEEVDGRHWSRFYSPRDASSGKPDAALIIAESKGRFEEEGWRVRKDGSRFFADCVLSALRGSTGSLRGFACMLRDVTERRLLEQEILDIAQREQQRIGQDLHDSLGQRLTGISLLAKALEKKLASAGSPNAKDAALICEKAVEAAGETRRLARGLFSAELESNRLIPALQQLLDDAALMFGVKGSFECDPKAPAPPQSVSSQLYHIAQEAIHNAVRHGQARAVWLGLETTGEGALLTIRDDGSGIPAKLPKDRGMGLRIMNYRAALIGGGVVVGRHPEGGTLVTCRVAPGAKNDTIEARDKKKR